MTPPGSQPSAKLEGVDPPIIIPTVTDFPPATVITPPAAAGAVNDYKPVIVRNTTNGLSQAELVRDRIYDLFAARADSRRAQLLLLKSPPFTSPPWVKIECWIRHAADAALALRSTATLYIRPREFHRFPVEIDLVTFDQKTSQTCGAIITFGQTEADVVLEYLLNPYAPPSFRFQRCRQFPFQLWRPRNKPSRLATDARVVIVQALAIVGIFTVAFGIGIFLLIAAALLSHFNRKRRHYVLSAGKPAQEPRNLIRLDSWQTLVNSLGADRDATKAALREELSRITEADFQMTDERIWYWGVDGKEEREQLVLRYKRGLAFVQLYRYGDDLFVGWDAHVNCGDWEERVAGSGFDRTTQQLCFVYTIAAGWHVPNEYDLSDTNCLIERVHAAVTKVVKRKLEEKKIDQEIDFKILREERQNITGRKDTREAAGGLKRSWASKLTRVH